MAVETVISPTVIREEALFDHLMGEIPQDVQARIQELLLIAHDNEVAAKTARSKRQGLLASASGAAREADELICENVGLHSEMPNYEVQLAGWRSKLRQEALDERKKVAEQKQNRALGNTATGMQYDARELAAGAAVEDRNYAE